MVFSYWTRTLDIVQSALISSSITYTRFDGKVPPRKRETVLQTFREQMAINVLLISISCGGTGLDLTAASRVYLLEPQWNPMIEEQALNRVHRMGQTKDVTTIRYIMESSIEEVMPSHLAASPCADHCRMFSRYRQRRRTLLILHCRGHA